MNTCTLKDSACSLSSFEWDANHVLDKHTLLQESNKYHAQKHLLYSHWVTNQNAVVEVRNFLQNGEKSDMERNLYTCNILNICFVYLQFDNFSDCLLRETSK